jgi:hypothetical protein
MILVPATKDLIQESRGNLEVPEIRVWCHPHFLEESGGDYYEVFDNFREAIEFTKTNRRAEKVPLIAFRGYELNIFDMKPEKLKSKTKAATVSTCPSGTIASLVSQKLNEAGIPAYNIHRAKGHLVRVEDKLDLPRAREIVENVILNVMTK